MARYGLILKDITYVELFKKAQIQGYSLGKYINQILEEQTSEKNTSAPLQKDVCCVCGDKKIIASTNTKCNKTLYFCFIHDFLPKKHFQNYKEIKNNDK